MSWLKGFKGRVETDVPLANLTWFRLGGPARWLVAPRDRAELADLLRRAYTEGVRTRVLGRGANVLVRDEGFDGVVIRLTDEQFARTTVDGLRVRAGGGAELMPLALACARKGLAGLEAMAGIPGTVGGAVRMNAGGRHGQFGDVVDEVELVDERGEISRMRKDELEFGYRRSAVGSRTVISATLGLRQVDPAETMDRFHAIGAEKKRSQPLGDKSAGCVFKNPKGASAGAMIDRSGMKGASRGGARVSDRHANFIVASADATSADVLALVDDVREAVRREQSVELELEIDVW